ncbi:hypothetical protein Brsp04_04368 [Brucella sp. NBRC 12952]
MMYPPPHFPKAGKDLSHSFLDEMHIELADPSVAYDEIFRHGRI